MKTRVAINGFGRIGRAFFRAAMEEKGIDIVAINDLGNTANLAYLLKYDSAYGKFSEDVKGEDGILTVGGEDITVLHEREPSRLPWRDMNIDVVVESTGIFETYAEARAHVDAGAKRVVVTAPMKDEPQGDMPGATVLMGVNEEKLKTCIITSNASCTTNAGSPLLTILHESIGIKKAILNTVHAYTATQSIVDSPAKGDPRRGRAAAQNITPSSTGAAIATTKAIPDLEGKFDGVAIRVPVVVGSLVDITFISNRETSAEEVNSALKKAAKDKRWSKVFSVTEEPIVSTDIIGDTHASIADLSFTRVVDGDLVKILAWYDNETGYANALLDHVLKLGVHV